MNPQEKIQSLTISQIDDELTYDLTHILMNYLKMQSFSSNCFSETNIQISPSILNASLTQQEIENYNQFSNKYFTLLLSQENTIDVIAPIISNYPNSELGLFLSVILNKHLIEISQSLNNSKTKFEKYKTYLINIYQSILKSNNKQKLLETICSSITVLIVIGIYGNWTNGIEQLIGAAKVNNGGDFGNVLMASLIISNINEIFQKLKEKLPKTSVETIESYIKTNSNIIQEFINFLITSSFNGQKENFVNGLLFKSFIGIVQSFKYFNLNIIKIHGFLDFLINCIPYINVNHDLIIQICDIFEQTFSDKSNIGLIFDCKLEYNNEYIVSFLNNIANHQDFQEIKKCIELINNVKSYYSTKDLTQVKSNEKDIQILFASCNIFSNLIENFSYVFFLPELDIIIQEIFLFFIGLPIYKISQILLSSLTPLVYLFHNGYKFNNFTTNDDLQNKKLQAFNTFLYNMHNCVFQNMKISSMTEYKDLCFGKSTINNHIRLDKYISEILKGSISDDEKVNYIINATEFYENLYEIINNLYGIEDFSDKLCKYLINAVNNKEINTIDCILLVFNKIEMNLNNKLPSIIFNLIEYILNDSNNIILNDTRLCLQFIHLMLVMRIPISKNRKYINLIILKLLTKKYKEEKMNLIIINFIYKLISTSYQTFKNNNKSNDDEDKNEILNVFNILCKDLLDNISNFSYIYLIKLIDSIFASCFYNLYIGNLENNVLLNICEKLLNNANQIFSTSSIQKDNKKELYMKYIHIVFSIINNVGKEKSDLLIEIYNKIDPNPNLNNSKFSENNNITYFKNIENNIIVIINDCSQNSKNSDTNIINSIITLSNSIIKSLKDKTAEYYPAFSGIFSLINQLNPENIKELDLVILLYKNIFNHCKLSPIYIQISENCFDIVKFMNSKFKFIKNDEDRTLLCTKICEFILLYFPNFSQNISKICDKHSNNNCIISFTLNELIETFEKNGNEEYDFVFSTLIKTFCENNMIFNGFIKDYAYRLTSAIITHLQLFKSAINKSVPNYFMIFKYFYSGARVGFLDSIKRIFNNDNQIIYAIEVYLDNINYTNYNNLEIAVQNNNQSFIKELGQMLYSIDSKKNEFVSKYVKLADETNKKQRNGLKLDNICENKSSHISIIHK